MGKYVIRRLLQMIPVIIGVTFIIYAAVFALGDPTVGRCGERACPPGYIAAFRKEYNLDQPLIVQYLLYMGNLIQGDLGTNFYGNEVVDELAVAVADDSEAGLHGPDHRVGHRHHRRGAGRHPAGEVHRQPGDGQHPVPDLHPHLRDRQPWPS